MIYSYKKLFAFWSAKTRIRSRAKILPTLLSTTSKQFFPLLNSYVYFSLFVAVQTINCTFTATVNTESDKPCLYYSSRHCAFPTGSLYLPTKHYLTAQLKHGCIKFTVPRPNFPLSRFSSRRKRSRCTCFLSVPGGRRNVRLITQSKFRVFPFRSPEQIRLFTSVILFASR
jgi:hypothetical protein